MILPDTRRKTGGGLPDFLIIGAMKSGTTTLHEYLRRHPGVFLCQPKEPKYFSRDAVYARGETWYRGLFSDATEGQIIGEASTCYTRWPHYPGVPDRIVQLLPNVRFIYLMRHPVERCYSHYCHIVEERRMAGQSMMTFEEALERDEEIVNTSLYMQQIERYLERFSIDRFLFLLLDNLKAHPSDELSRVQRFLGLEERELGAADPIVANRTSGRRLARRRILRGLRRISKLSGFSLLAGKLPDAWRRRTYGLAAESLLNLGAGRFLARDYARDLSEMSPATRRGLLERFEEPTKELAKFLDRDLSGWLV